MTIRLNGSPTLAELQAVQATAENHDTRHQTGGADALTPGQIDAIPDTGTPNSVVAFDATGAKVDLTTATQGFVLTYTPSGLAFAAAASGGAIALLGHRFAAWAAITEPFIS